MNNYSLPTSLYETYHEFWNKYKDQNVLVHLKSDNPDRCFTVHGRFHSFHPIGIDLIHMADGAILHFLLSSWDKNEMVHFTEQDDTLNDLSAYYKEDGPYVGTIEILDENWKKIN